MKELPELTNGDVGLIMRAALDFNSNILVAATYFYGNMDNRRNQEKFRKAINDSSKAYEKQLKEIVNGLDNK